MASLVDGRKTSKTVGGDRKRLTLGPMRVERARYFLAAVETGSIRAAAIRCGVSQPSLGQQVVMLEEELDVVLFTRSRNGVRPTLAGQALIEPMTRLVAAEDAVRDAAADSSGAYRGTVSIGAISVLAETVIAPVVGHLREHHLDLRFTLSESSSTDIESRVVVGDLDFGVITMPTDPVVHSLLRSPLLTASVGALVRTDHLFAQREILHWHDLETWPIVAMQPGTVMWERLHQGISRPDVVVQAMSARSVALMVAHGAGVGILAPFTASVDLPGLHWIPIRDCEPIHIGLVQRRDTQPSPSALIVRGLIQDRATELLDSAVVGVHPPE